MINHLNLSIPEQALLIESVSQKLDISSIAIEKDFWVCWMLKTLFLIPNNKETITFKGGTSLSKVYQVIERFSEDIDLTLNKSLFIKSLKDDPLEKDISNKERERRIDRLREAAKNYVTKNLYETLKENLNAALPSKVKWDLVIDTEDKDGQTILFYYNSVLDSQSKYIKPIIRLEFGVRGDSQPSEIQPINSYLISVLPKIETLMIPTLKLERTFWEKITILHSLVHNAKLRDRMSRHYYDVYMMSNKPGLVESAINQGGLLEEVVQNKRIFFKDTKASYETAMIGSLRLIKGLISEGLEQLKRDYISMNEMFTIEPPAFQDLVTVLTKLEDKLNK